MPFVSKKCCFFYLLFFFFLDLKSDSFGIKDEDGIQAQFGYFFSFIPIQPL